MAVLSKSSNVAERGRRLSGGVGKAGALVLCALGQCAWLTVAGNAVAQGQVVEKVLVISGVDDTRAEPERLLATKSLDKAAVAYDELITTKSGARVSDKPLNLTNADGSPKYAGIVLTTGQVLFQDTTGAWASGLTPDQWAELTAYSVRYHARIVALYAFPLAEDGVQLEGTTGLGDPAFLATNPDMATIAKPVDHTVDLTLRGSWRYPSKITDPDHTKALYFFQKSAADPSDRSVASAVTTYADGHERLSFFFLQGADDPVSVAIAPLWIKWVRSILPLDE